MRRGVKALLASAVLLPVLAPVASAEPGLVVRVNGGDPTTFPRSLFEPHNDVHDAQFKVSVPGQDPETRVVTGFSVREFLLVIGQSPDHVQQVVVDKGGDSGSVTIERPEILNGINGPDGQLDATFGTGFSSNSIQFIRPRRFEGDPNGPDAFGSTIGGTLDVAVASDGVRRDLDAGADQYTLATGQPASLHVRVLNPPGGVTWTFTWTLEPGKSIQTTAESLPYGYKDGTYLPQVTMQGSDGSWGTYTFTRAIRVGTSSEPTPTPTASSTASPTATPDQTEQGGTGGPGAGGGVPAPGGGEGNKRDAATGPKRNTSKSSRASDGSKRGEATPTATPTADAAATATATASANAAPHGSGTGNAGGQAKTGDANSGTSKTTESSAPTPGATAAPETGAGEKGTSAPQGVQVDGILLASAGSIADVIEAARSALPTKQDRSQARRGGGDSAPIGGWVGGGAGLLGLLLLGAVREGGFRR
jgi:hypothetical protein